MKYAYLGDHESVDFYGVHFPVGVFVEVTHTVLLGKLAGNNHFQAEIIQQETNDAQIEEEPAPIVQPVKRGRKAK